MYDDDFFWNIRPSKEDYEEMQKEIRKQIRDEMHEAYLEEVRKAMRGE